MKSYDFVVPLLQDFFFLVDNICTLLRYMPWFERVFQIWAVWLEQPGGGSGSEGAVSAEDSETNQEKR